MDDMVNNLQLVMVNIWMILEVNISNLWYLTSGIYGQYG